MLGNRYNDGESGGMAGSTFCEATFLFAPRLGRPTACCLLVSRRGIAGPPCSPAALFLGWFGEQGYRHHGTVTAGLWTAPPIFMSGCTCKLPAPAELPAMQAACVTVAVVLACFAVPATRAATADVWGNLAPDENPLVCANASIATVYGQVGVLRLRNWGVRRLVPPLLSCLFAVVCV